MQEEKHARSDEHEHLDWSAFDADSHLKIATATGSTGPQVSLRELRVDERFVEVKYESFPTTEFGSLGWNHGVLLGHGYFAEAAGSRKFINLLLCER